MGYGSGWGTVGQNGVTAYGAFGGVATSSTEPSASATSSSSGSLGLPSPKGDKIPQGIGTFQVQGALIVDPELLGGVTQDGDKVKVNLVLGFCETTLGGTVSLVNIKANDKYIYRTEVPTKAFPGTIRFYGGDQAALDPLLDDQLDNPTYWPKLAYAVLEGFDIAPYDNQLPSFQVELSTGLTAGVLSSGPATLTFGAPLYGGGSFEHAIDKTRKHYYTADFDGLGQIWILTLDVMTNMEVNRARVTWAGGTTDYIGYWTSLDGSDYIVGALIDNADNFYKLALINTVTGTVESVLANLSQSGTQFEPQPMAAQLITSGAATKYLVFSDALSTISNGQARMMVTVANITAGTLTNVCHQFSNPVAAAGSGECSSLAFGKTIDGKAIIFFIVSDIISGQDNVVWKAVLSAAGLVSAATVFTGTDCRGVAYDTSDDRIVVYKADGTLTKVTSAGTTLYSVASGISNLRINYRVYETGGQFQFKTRAGFAAGRDFGNKDVYLIDLSDGSVSLVIDFTDYDDSGYDYYDQTKGYFITEFSAATDPGMTRFVLPLSTVPVMDLQTVYTKLAEYRGKFSSGDLQFDGFTGGECYGVVYPSETTLDNAEQDANNIFDVKIVPSDGKRKYVKAKRDGSFALDDTIASTSIVEQADFNIQKTMQSDEQSLVGARISYIDRNARYERTDQEYRRPVGIYSVTRSDRVEDVSTNFVLSSSQAMQAITTKVYRSNFGLDVYNFTVAPQKFYLEPADIVQFDFEGFTVVGQINEANLSGEAFTQDMTVTQYVQAIDATFTGIDINTPDLTDLSYLTRFLYLDAPLISTGDDLGGSAVRQYAMMSGYGYSAFQGATLYRSFDGDTYGVVTSRYGVTPVVGLLKAVTGSPNATIEAIDATTTLEVTILSGDTADLVTITETEMLAGGNRALIGKAGRWVIIYFQTVSVTNKIATISNIVWSSPFYQTFLNALTPGDYFVLLQTGHHVRFSGEVTKLGDDIFYKAASDAFPVSSVPTEEHALVGRAEMPFPPLHLNAVVDGSDIDLSWDWRSRLYGGSILPGSDNTLGEATLAFEIEIMDGATVKRTLTATTNSKTYLAADIATDFGTMPDDLTFRVYQISALVGRGYVAEKTASFVAVSGVGAAAGTSTAAAVGRSTFAAAGAASGTGAATGIGSSTAESIGAAAGTSTGAAVSDIGSAGTAAGVGAASGIGESTAAATASAAGTGAASGTGVSTFAATASAAGTGTASAVGDSIITDPNFSSVVLLLGFEGVDGATSTTDECATPHTMSFLGNAQIDTAEKKFGASSLLLDGTGDYVSATDSADWDLGAGQFTAETWVRFASGFGTNEAFLGQWGSAAGDQSWFFFLNAGTLTFRFRDTGGTNRDTTVAWTPTVNTWYHLAVDRDASNKFRIYRDGSMVASATFSQTMQNGTGLLGLGRIPGFTTFDLNGWMDEVRVTKGVARYASDSGFTAPTAAYPRS